MPINPEQQFKQLLRDLFQLDHTDLDFGIYRILNLRSADVEKFIDEKLPAKLQEVRTKLASRGLEDVQAQLEAAQKNLKDNFQVDFDADGDLQTKVDQYGQLALFKEPYNKYLEAKEQLQAVQISAEFEKDIYNELYRFFQRYYDGGDFVTKPRAGDNAYMIPYNGEEVKLYWANHDQYYIKTGDNFKNYVFTNGIATPNQDVIVEFRLKEAETAQNNNIEDKDRRFVPTEDFFQWDAESRTLNLWFRFTKPTPEEKEKWGDKQDVKSDNKGINQKIMLALPDLIKETNDPYLVALFEKTKPDSKGNPIPIFFYHLQRYTSINSFDYFIHKDLRKFLSTELDYFLKNEVLSINFLAADWSEQEVETAIKRNVIRSGAIRDIALQIIDFMAELEDFQKLLYEKKKFVVQSDWCFTLDLIPASVYAEITQYVLSDPKKKQLKEWRQLGFIENLSIDAAYMQEHDKLVLDTQFLTVDLKDKLLSSIDDLDELCSGLLINSDNWQGLKFLSEKYKREIKCVYIDPPYNAKSSEISYKNTYKHSSWISLMESRILESKQLLSKDACYVIAIDENEQERLGLLLDKLFPDHSKTCISVIHNPSGIQGDNFSYNHEFAYFVYPRNGRSIGLETRDIKDADIRPLRDVSKGNHLRVDAATCFYPIYVKDKKIIGFGDVCEDDFHPSSANVWKDDILEIYPIDANGEERKWVFARDNVETILKELSIEKNKSRNILDVIRTKTVFNYKTVWSNKKYSANSYGSKLLNDMLGAPLFSFPKSLHTVYDSVVAGINNKNQSIVLDYFAGSGTTGHAIIKRQREHQEGHRFIMLEMGDYFRTVTKPRIQKAIYSSKWKKGLPTKLDDGISHAFQYLKIEQYEDALNNIEFSPPINENTLENLSFNEIEKLKYALRIETVGSSSLLTTDKFNTPFDYEMDIVELNERKPTNIDLLTTFNFLLGIKVKRIHSFTHQNRTYRVVTGIKGKQQFVIVWRNYDDALDLAVERDHIRQQEWYSEDARTYCNADNAFGAASTEEEFKRLMFEGTDG